MTMKMRNKLMKIKNGNRSGRGRGLKIMTWNKSSSRLENGLNEIEVLIKRHQPDILGLSESNLYNDVDISTVTIDNYTLHTAPTLNNKELNISRTVIYTNTNVISKRRADLEDEGLSAIWLEVGLPRKKKIFALQFLQRMAVHGTNYK